MYIITLPSRFVSKSRLTCYNFLSFSRFKSDKSQKSKKGVSSKRYSDTLNLPKTSFRLTLRDGVAAKKELEIQKTTGFDKLYEWQQNQDRPKEFVIHDGPPYANGKPHVGHVINKVLKDITNRYKLMRGYKVNYVPGWDCHGLPIELKAVDHQKDLSPLQIRNKARKFVKETIKIQKDAFKRWGIMADWNNCYTTLDPQYQINQWDVFYNMYEKGLIYQDFMPVYWSPSSKTALAEAELEYSDKHVSTSVYVKFPMVRVPTEISRLAGDESEVYAVVWTTTPWTLPFNQAVCYSPDIRYAILRDMSSKEVLICEEAFTDTLKTLLPSSVKLLGSVQGSVFENSTYRQPLTGRRCPVLPGGHVISGRGTGLVHTAPAHGHDDFQLAVRFGLPVVCEVDELGRYEETVGQHLSGKTVGKDADCAVIERLGSHVIHQEPFTHSYPYDWRTGKPVIIRASKQWFVNTSRIRDRAKEYMAGVHVYPARSEQDMVRQLGERTYWCISRQRVWGLPIPVFYHRQTHEPLLNRDIVSHLQTLLTSHGSDFWWTLDMSQILPDSLLQHGQSSADYVRGEDILDIWFDSGTSWATLLKSHGHECDVYLEGLDQYGCWFQTSLLTSVAVNDKAPYRKLIVHGFTTDEEGRKMSKSVGNVVDPNEVINGGKNKEASPAYGVDILRWWVAHSHLKSRVSIGSTVLDRYLEEMYNLRKTVRHLLGNLSDFKPSHHMVNYDALLPVERYMLHLLYGFATKVESHYENVSYNLILRDLEWFLNNKVSRFYFNVIKDRCYCGESDGLPRQSSQTFQYHLLDVLTRCLAPIIPHLAEEVYQHHPGAQTTDGVQSIFRTEWFNLSADWNNPDMVPLLETVFTIRDDLNSILASENLAEFDAIIYASHNLAEILREFQSEETSSTSSLTELLQVSHTSVIDHVPTIIPDDADTVDGTCTVVVDGKESVEHYKVIVMASEHYICERCRRYTSESATTPCDRCLDVMAKTWGETSDLGQ